MHASTKDIGNDQTKQLRDGGVLRLERVDRSQNRRKGAQTDAQEDRPERANRKVRVVVCGQNLTSRVRSPG